ncbi:17383_t:CDS:2, partial [Gigaspora margarita]
LLSWVNLDKGLAEGFIVGMFLSGLKKNNATFVAVAAPKNLNEAIAAARRVEAASKSQQKLESELSDLKKRIDEMALNYAALTDKIKNIKEKVGHMAQDCMVEKSRQLGEKETLVRQKNINFYSSWYKRLKERKVPKIQNWETEETRQEIDLTQNLDIEGLNKSNKPKLKYEESMTRVVMATGSKASTLGIVKKVKIKLKDIIVPITLYQKLYLQYATKTVEVPISNTRFESLKLYEEEEIFNSEGEEIDKVEGCFIEKYFEENSALFLTNVVEVPIEEIEEEVLIESKIQ